MALTSNLTGAGYVVTLDPPTPEAFQPRTWANRPPAAASPGGLIRVTDVGGGPTGNGGGTVMVSNGTRWKPLNVNALLDVVDTANAGAANTAEQQLNPNHVLIPAGVIGDNDRLRVFLSMSKNGTADSCTIRVRFGPLGTVADPVIATITSLATTNQSLGTILQFKRLTATTIQMQGNGDPNVSFGGVSAAAFSAAVTVANMNSTAMYLSITAQMTGGTEAATLQDYTLELLTTDSV